MEKFVWIMIAIGAVISIIQAISSSVAGPSLQNKFGLYEISRGGHNIS